MAFGRTVELQALFVYRHLEVAEPCQFFLGDQATMTSISCHPGADICSLYLFLDCLVVKEWYFTTSAAAFHDPKNRVPGLDS